MGSALPAIDDLYVAILMVLTLSFSITYLLIPWVIRKMEKAGMRGHDVNKLEDREVAEMGGIAVVFGFAITMTITVGIRKLIGDDSEVPALAIIGVFFVAATIGIFDDIAVLKRREKAILVIFASLPLIIAHNAVRAEILFPGGWVWNFDDGFSVYMFYWMILVPIGITGAANAINLSAGYNGLESGEVAVVSFFLVLVGLAAGIQDNEAPNLVLAGSHAMIILTALFGGAMALYMFNRTPAKVFVGDTGTLGMGAVIGAAAILGNIQIFAMVCIAPAFYEMAATVFYSVKHVERRDACMNPIILKDGRLKPPKGAEKYTLAYVLLSKKPMTEKKLVRTLLMLYAISGAAAVALAFTV